MSPLIVCISPLCALLPWSRSNITSELSDFSSVGAFNRRESWGRDIVALSLELLGEGFSKFNIMVRFNSLSFFFFSKNVFKSDIGRPVVFTFLAGPDIWAGLGFGVKS